VEARSIFLPFHIPLMIRPGSCSGIGLQYDQGLFVFSAQPIQKGASIWVLAGV